MIKLIRRFFNRSITRKLIFGISAVHAVLMSIFVFDLVEREKDFLISQNKSQAKSLVKVLAINASSGVLSNDLIALEEIILAQQEYPNINYSMIVNLQNKVLAYTYKENVGLFLNDSISQQLLTLPPGSIILVNDELSLDAAFPIMSNDTHIGWARVSLNKSSIVNNINLVTERGVLYSVLAILIGILFAWLMAKGLILSIVDTTSALTDFEGGKRHFKIKNKRHDELGELNIGLQRMFDTLTNQESLLKNNHDLLELEVKNRTQDLEMANVKTQQYSDTIKKDKVELEVAYKELIKFQQELVEKEKFAQLGKLIAGVAHELNTPLGVAITSSSIIHDKLGQLKAKVESASLSKQDFLELIGSIEEANTITDKNIARCTTLVSSFKKISTDVNIEEIRTIKIADYIKDILQTLSVLLKKEKITLSVQGYNSDVSIEPAILAQVITNLVTNSIKHAFSSEEERKKITIIITEQKQWMTIEYKDNGCGMSANVMEHVFEPFYTTKRNQGGTGLGMNIVYNLVKKNLGGNITLNSTVGEGTSIFIQLPKMAN